MIRYYLSMDGESAEHDLVIPDDSRGPGPPPSAQGYGDPKTGWSEQPQQIFAGEAESWLPLEDREMIEHGRDRIRNYSPEILPGQTIERYATAGREEGESTT